MVAGTRINRPRSRHKHSALESGCAMRLARSPKPRRWPCCRRRYDWMMATAPPTLCRVLLEGSAIGRRSARSSWTLCASRGSSIRVAWWCRNVGVWQHTAYVKPGSMSLCTTNDEAGGTWLQKPSGCRGCRQPPLCLSCAQRRLAAPLLYEPELGIFQTVADDLTCPGPSNSPTTVRP